MGGIYRKIIGITLTAAMLFGGWQSGVLAEDADPSADPAVIIEETTEPAETGETPGEIPAESQPPAAESDKIPAELGTLENDSTQIKTTAEPEKIVRPAGIAKAPAVPAAAAIPENAVTIQQPMAGDVVLSTEENENYFNGGGNDCPAMGILTKFTLSDDVRVNPKYIVQVTYNLGVRIASGNCLAAYLPQTWDFYLTDGSWQEFRATYSSLETALADTSRPLLQTQYQAKEANVFDITEGYKQYIGESGRDFAIHTVLSDYQAVFFGESQPAYNYLTYVIDHDAILADLNAAQTPAELEALLLENGRAIGLDIGTFKHIADREAVLNALLDGQEKDAAAFKEIMNAAMAAQMTGELTLNRMEQTYFYEENMSGQNKPATLSGRGTGAVWSPQTTKDKAVFIFDLSEIPTEYLASAKFTVNRNGGGRDEGKVECISLYVPNASSQDPFYLDFVQTDEKFYSFTRNNNARVDITGYISDLDGKLYVGLAGIDNECMNSDARILLQYNTAQILEAVAKSNVTQTKRLLTDYGAVMGLNEDQMRPENLGKAALALAGKEIGSLEEFLETVAAGIAGIRQSDVINAMNDAADQTEFQDIVLEFGSILDIDTELLAQLTPDTQAEIWTELYQNGSLYPTAAAFVSKYNTLVAKGYESILANLQGDDLKQTAEFLLEYGVQLGISQEDLDQHLDILSLAFTTGGPITDIRVFKEIYLDYVNAASRSIVGMLNRAESAEVFDQLLRQYADTLEVDLTGYDKISDKTGIFASLKGAASDKASFQEKFNAEISRYFSPPVNVYATEEMMTNPKSTAPDNSIFQGWIGNKESSASHFLKYDLTGMTIDTEKLVSATLQLQIADREDQENREDITFQLYTAGTNWKETVDYYSTMLAKGVMENQKLVATKHIPVVHRGQFVTLDITDYIKELAAQGQIGEIAFQAALEKDSIIIVRQGDSTEFAPIELTYLDADSALVSYTPENGSTDVPIGTDVQIQFEKALNAQTVNNQTITVWKNGETMEDGYTVQAGGSRVSIQFDNPLDYETQYSVDISKDVKYAGDPNSYIFNGLNFTTEKRPFEFKGLTVLCAGKEIASLAERTEDTVTASARVNNNSMAQPQKIVLLIGLYRTENGVTSLLDVKTVSKVLAAGEYALAEKAFQIPADGGEYRIEAYVWDSFTGMNKLFSEKMF